MTQPSESTKPASIVTSDASTVKAIKSVKFRYTPTRLTMELLRTFRDMVNQAIHICIEENIKGRLKLRDRLYKELQERYRVVSCYPYCVAEVAWSIVKKHRKWHRRPYAKRLMMKMDRQNYSLNYSILSIAFRRGERLLIPLRYGDYQRSFLMNTSIRRGSVTITDSAIIIAFAKEASPVEPMRRIGIDLNEKSAVCSDGTRYDLSEVARLHTEYGVRRRDFYQRHPLDTRLKKKYASTRRERERIKQVLHRKAKEIVRGAKSESQAIVLERLNGIRYAHPKGNWEGKTRRRMLAQWPFRNLQSYIVYKAGWEGVRVEFVSAARTSQTCNKCRYINKKLKLTEREWRCPNCGAILDRDLNAAINIERRGKIPCLGEVRPGALDTYEAVKGNEQMSAPILRAEVSKPT